MLLKVKSQKSKVKSEKSKLRILFVICFFVFGISSYAQCAMCRAALTSEGNTAKAQAVNDGIVYLMIIPYLLFAGVGYYIYWMWNKKK